MIKVKIISKNKRAEERIKTHGVVMELLRDERDRFLVQSLSNTWSKQKWMGWFNKKTEANFEFVREK